LGVVGLFGSALIVGLSGNTHQPNQSATGVAFNAVRLCRDGIHILAVLMSSNEEVVFVKTRFQKDGKRFDQMILVVSVRFI
jgi:hypothetical protein